MKYEFSAKAYQHSTSADMCGWTFVSFPLKAKIRKQENIILDEDVKIIIWV